MATQAEYARHRGVSRKTITLWKQRGLLVFDAEGGVDFTKTDEMIAGHGGKLTPLPVRAVGARRVTPQCPHCGHPLSPA